MENPQNTTIELDAHTITVGNLTVSAGLHGSTVYCQIGGKSETVGSYVLPPMPVKLADALSRALEAAVNEHDASIVAGN
jgi:hypothetical protein